MGRWLWKFLLSFSGGISIFLLSVTAAAPAADNESPRPADYSQGSNWLCRPGRSDACAQDQQASVLAADGSLAIEPWQRAASPPIDCFYLYPTISSDRAGNSDLTAGTEERHITDQQFARLGSQCRLFAPVYRQITMAALQASVAGQAVLVDPERAYRDVRAAWRHYLAHDNHGRGFVLIGHSQGARLLIRLLKEEVDGTPVQRQLVSAVLVGSNVEVARGKDSGGDFRKIPLCLRTGQTGCVIAYESFRASAPPPAVSRFSHSDRADREVACVNPAELSGDNGALKPYFPVRTGIYPTMPRWTWVEGKAIRTRFVTTPGLVRAHCVRSADSAYLAIDVARDPAGPRADDIPGDIIVSGAPLADWGLHPADISLAMGNLETIVGVQAQAYRHGSARGAR